MFHSTSAVVLNFIWLRFIRENLHSASSFQTWLCTITYQRNAVIQRQVHIFYMSEDKQRDHHAVASCKRISFFLTSFCRGDQTPFYAIHPSSDSYINWQMTDKNKFDWTSCDLAFAIRLVTKPFANDRSKQSFCQDGINILPTLPLLFISDSCETFGKIEKNLVWSRSVLCTFSDKKVSLIV